MRWAIISHPEQWVNGQLLQIPKPIAEDCLPVAIAQGWIVLARDSEFPVKPMDMNLLNPRREEDDAA